MVPALGKDAYCDQTCHTDEPTTPQKSYSQGLSEAAGKALRKQPYQNRVPDDRKSAYDRVH
jgi:hypothetical protein